MAKGSADVSNGRILDRYGPWAVVAGASEGIGRAWCQRLAARGLGIVLVARREEPLAALAKELQAEYGVEVRHRALDLGGQDLIAAVVDATRDLEVALLVYNAAFAPIGRYVTQPLEEKLTTLDVNCRGVVALTSHFGPQFQALGRGGIVLMSSMSGWQGGPFVAVYAASKAFITTLGEALWHELRPHGVDVLVCVAGATKTPSFLAQTPADKQRGAFPLQPEAVVDAALAHMGRGPTVIPGPVNRLAYVALSKLLPRRLAIRFFGRMSLNLYGEMIGRLSGPRA